MREPIAKSLQSLKGLADEALQALAEGRWEQCQEVLARRDRVFANFQALDHLASSRGWNLRDDQELGALFRSVCTSHHDLTRAMAEVSQETTCQLRRLTRGSRASQGYHSGVAPVTRLRTRS